MDLEKRKEVYGEYWCLKDLRKILKIGQVETKILIN
jgi:hypothetical protein